jgi:cadherin 22
MTTVSLGPLGPGTSVMQVMASDADDPTYGSSARLVYSVLDGEHHFTVDPKTGEGPLGPGAGPEG